MKNFFKKQYIKIILGIAIVIFLGISFYPSKPQQAKLQQALGGGSGTIEKLPQSLAGYWKTDGSITPATGNWFLGTKYISTSAIQLSDGSGASSIGWTGKPQMYSSYGALMFSGNGIAFNNLYGSWSFALDVNNGVAIGGAFAMQHTPPANGLIVAGNTGIGRYDPRTVLDVYSSNLDANALMVGTNDYYIGINSYGVSAFGYDLYMSAGTGHDFIFRSGATEYMRLYSTGKFTIGHSYSGLTQYGKLTIADAGTPGDSELLTLSTSYAGGGYSGTRKSLTWRDGADNIVGQIDTNFDGSSIMKMSFGHLYNSGYQTGDIMTLQGNGNVGIGTSTPSFKLDVYGTIAVTDNSSGIFISNGTGTSQRQKGLRINSPFAGEYNDIYWYDGNNVYWVLASGGVRNFNILNTDAGMGLIVGSATYASTNTAKFNAKVDILNTSGDQLRLSYDGTTNYGTFGVDSTGILTLTSVGTNSNIYLKAGTHSANLRISPASIAYTGPTNDYTYFTITSQAGVGNGYAAKLLLQNANGASAQFDMPDSGGGTAWYTHPSNLTLSMPSGYGMIFNTNGVDNNGIKILTTGVLIVTQAPTASAPTYVKGGIYFDTTLNKLRVGGATAWETITSS